MIIGIDGHEANQLQRVGVGWYGYHLLHEFKKRATTELEFRIFLQSPPQSDMPAANRYFQYVVVPKKTLWSQIDLPLYLFSHPLHLKVFFSPAHYAPRFCPCPTVVVIHDLAYFYYPSEFLPQDLYQLQNWTAYSVRAAQKVIAVSEVTKQDLIKNYSLPPHKISVVPNGFQPYRGGRSKPGVEIKQPYFLYLGTLQPRKNLPNLLQAFQRFHHIKPEFNLYLVGKKGWLYENLLPLVAKMKLEKCASFLDYMPEAEKWWLLQHAEALVLPGFYEGFGLPMLEAFAAKTPVLASHWGALPEVGQNAALYFEPNQVAQIVEAFQKIAGNQTLRQQKIKDGEERLKNYSWSQTAQQILELLTN